MMVFPLFVFSIPSCVLILDFYIVLQPMQALFEQVLIQLVVVVVLMLVMIFDHSRLKSVFLV